MKAAVLFASILATAIYRAVGQCPHEPVPGCRCNYEDGKTIVECYYFRDTLQLAKTVESLKGYRMDSLEIISFILPYLPEIIFRHLPATTMKLSSGQIAKLDNNDRDQTFGGGTGYVKSFILHRVTGLSNWKFSALKRLEKLESLSVLQCDISRISNDFSSVAPYTLKEIEFSSNPLYRVHEGVFARYYNLETISLYNNLISEVKRNMFPMPANRLRKLKLSHNKLSSLPADMFRGMPALQSIDLQGNEFHTLPEELFLPIIRQHWTLDISINNIQCCREIDWIPKVNTEKTIYGECAYPLNLHGRKLSTLTDSDISNSQC